MPTLLLIENYLPVSRLLWCINNRVTQLKVSTFLMLLRVNGKNILLYKSLSVHSDISQF